MKWSHRLCACLALAGVGAGLGMACDEGIPPDAIRGAVRVDGSSTVFPITEATAEEFFLEERGIQVTVGVSGTGGGFERFCAGEIHINDASRPIGPSEIEECEANGIEFIELPVAFDGIAIVVNPENDFVECMTTAELELIWEPEAEGEIERWGQVRPDWPDTDLVLYGAGTDSGTFDYFTEVINGESGASRTDYTPSEDDNVLVQGVAGDRGALGYFGLAYYESNVNLVKAVAIDSGEGCILPSAETVSNGTYEPLSRPLLVYVREDAADLPEVNAFIDFYLENVQFLSEDVGYVALPQPVLEQVKQRWASQITGTMFGEENEGQRLEERLASN